MRQILCLVAGFAALPLAAQYRDARGRDYLFAASVSDARALWVNPGGLGVQREASVMGELVTDRSRTGSLAFNQYTAGFNSRGIAFGFRHDRYGDSVSDNTWRVGAGRGLGNIAVGIAMSFHSNGPGPTQRGVDVGVRYRLLPGLQLGAVVERLGKPVVNDSTLNVGGSLGLAWTPTSVVRIEAQGHFEDDPGSVGRSFRAGLGVRPPLVFPMLIGAVLDMDRNLAPGRLTLAITVGGPDRVIGVTSATRPGGSLSVDALSLTGVSTRTPQ